MPLGVFFFNPREKAGLVTLLGGVIILHSPNPCQNQSTAQVEFKILQGRHFAKMFVYRMAEIKALLALIGLPWTRSTLISTTVALGEASD